MQLARGIYLNDLNQTFRLNVFTFSNPLFKQRNLLKETGRVESTGPADEKLLELAVSLFCV